MEFISGEQGRKNEIFKGSREPTTFYIRHLLPGGPSLLKRNTKQFGDPKRLLISCPLAIKNTKTRYIRRGTLGTSRTVVTQPSWHTDLCKITILIKIKFKAIFLSRFLLSAHLACLYSYKTILAAMEEYVEVCTYMFSTIECFWRKIWNLNWSALCSE